MDIRQFFGPPCNSELTSVPAMSNRGRKRRMLKKEPTATTDVFLMSAESIREHFELSFTPSSQQIALLSTTLDGIESGKRVNLFPGAAGTGKTTCLLWLLRVLNSRDRRVTIAAPTNKAAQRAKELLEGREVRTVHQITYHGATDSEGSCTCDPGRPSTIKTCEVHRPFDEDLEFVKREDSSADVGDVLVIDEASMISQSVGEDLMDALPCATVVVAVGDGHQLPPVSEAPFFDLLDAPVQLTDVHRQEEGSPVLLAATQVRETGFPFNFSMSNPDWRKGQDILKRCRVPMVWQSRLQTATMFYEAFRETEGDAVAIVGTNNTRVVLNDAIRDALDMPGREDGPAVSERLICRCTGGGLVTSETVTVLDCKARNFGDFGSGWIVKVEDSHRRKKLVAVLESLWIGQAGVDIKHRGKADRGLKQEIEDEASCEVYSTACEAATQIVDKKSRLYFSKNKRHPSRYRVNNWTVWALLKKKAFATFLSKKLAQVDTGYAITCHASQGSEYKRVIVVADCVDFIDAEDPSQLYRWGYTALTRAKEATTVVLKSKNEW